MITCTEHFRLKLLSWYEKQAVIRELYTEVVKDQVQISEEKLRNAFVLLNQRLVLRQLLYFSEFVHTIHKDS